MNKETIQGLLRVISKEMGLQEDIEVLEIKPGSRIIIKYKQDPKKPSFSNGMIKLEREAKARLLMPIELILEHRDDMNKRTPTKDLEI